MFQEKFFIEDWQKQIILDQLLRIEEKFDLKFDAFSILSNHYHLLFYLNNGKDLKKILHFLNGGVSFQLNKLEKVNRAIWDKYKNYNVDDEDAFYNIMGYILGNPFKHGLVKDITELKNFKFSNYNEKVKEFGEAGILDIISRVKNLNWEVN